MGLLLFQAVSSVGKMQRQYQKAVIFESAYWSIRKLIDEAVAAREPNPGKAVPTLEQGCRFENISFGYGRETVLEWASLEIQARGLTVITGASGAGKTTLPDLLPGFYQPQDGRILVDGGTVRGIRPIGRAAVREKR